MLIDTNKVDDEVEVAAVLGGEQRLSLRISDLIGELEVIKAINLSKMSVKQQHRWHLPKEKAVRRFTAVLGADKSLLELTRSDGIRLKEYEQDRVLQARSRSRRPTRTSATSAACSRRWKPAVAMSSV